MLTLRLALRSLSNRKLATALTIASIALSVALLVGVETVRRGIRESFAGTIRGTDLIVGARGGTQQLLLSSVFGIGAPAGTVSWDSYQRWREHPAVKWTIPMALGDSHHGFRVVGTSTEFFEHYRYRNDGRVTLAAGEFFADEHDVVIGSDVAARRELSVGDEIAVTHGLQGTGIMDHDQHPFRVVGVLAATHTPVDRSLFVSLGGLAAMHDGFMADPTATNDSTVLSAFLLGTNNRFESLQLQREISTNTDEPLTAILPAVALGELWRSIGYAEDGARIITLAVVVVGLLGMLVSLYSTLQERRREMAILRSLGAGPRRVAGLLVLESGLLAAIGAAAGLVATYLLLFIGR
ncbi:MAG TPA: ABC transporter permease, partial [Gemmatimonadales bacterium]|nr:ABC transporter permease [Gemmatimonadales bacterium]